MQAIPWIVDVGYTVMCVALMLAVMGHVLFGDFEVTMTTLPDSISGEHTQLPKPWKDTLHTASDNTLVGASWSLLVAQTA